MKIIILIFLASTIISCKKDAALPLYAHNEFNATIKLMTGNILTLNALGAKAQMGCSYYGGGSFVSGISETNAEVSIEYIYSPNSSCVVAPGTYVAQFIFTENKMLAASPVYATYGLNDPRSISFTMFTNHHAEGTFNAVCKHSSDSVIIQGSFKGYME